MYKNIRKYTFGELNVVFAETEERKLRLIHYSVLPFSEETELEQQLINDCNLVEIQITGINQPGHKGNKLSNTLIGQELLLDQIEEVSDGLLITQSYQGEVQLTVETKLTAFENALRWQSVVKNVGSEAFGIEYLTSANLTNLNQSTVFQPYHQQQLYLPHNAWTGELQWEVQTLKEFGLDFRLDGERLQDSTKAIQITNASSWSCSQYNPSGILENPELGISTFWELDTNGEWHWEITDTGLGKYSALRLFGPTEPTNHWWCSLAPGESFETIPVLCGAVQGGFEASIRALNQYRRKIRRISADNEECPVIFNDYMNCLMGDPTTEKELPMIQRAAEIGCEYYVIDCGWYSDGYWWDNVGEWKESRQRFPNGVKELTDKIKEKGMIPGLWLEIEVMGIKSELANSLPDDWFFCRHGKRIKDHSRYHLDFRNPEVREYATSIVKRLIEDYGIGYIKMDYNITTGIGTDVDSDSFSDGLLAHNRAYLAWVDEIFATYPELVIENCGSGGMRHDYQMLSRHSIQSVTDQTDYLRNGAIAAACVSGVTPEQAAIWSYPLKEGDREEVIFNMVNALLLRIHQSGHIAELDQERLALVAEGIEIYKQIREQIPTAEPCWFTGIPHIDDKWFSFALETPTDYYLAVWRTESTNSRFSIPIPKAVATVQQLYPVTACDNSQFSFSNDHLLVEFKQNKMARFYQIKKK